MEGNKRGGEEKCKQRAERYLASMFSTERVDMRGAKDIDMCSLTFVEEVEKQIGGKKVQGDRRG